MSPSSTAPNRASEPRIVYEPPTNGSAARAVPFPILLQRRAKETLRAHLLRSAVRSGTLVIADAATLLAARGVVRAVRDHAVLGGASAEFTAKVLPHATASTAQLLAAAIIGLAATRNYGQGDRRRDASTLFAGVSVGLALNFWSRAWTGQTHLVIIGFVMAVLLCGSGLVLVRQLVDHVVRRMRPVSRTAMKVLVVGEAADARRALGNPALRDRAEFDTVGFLDAAQGIPAPDALGGVASLVHTIALHEVETVVVTGAVEHELLWRVVAHADAAGCHVLLLPHAAVSGRIAPNVVMRRGVAFVELTRPSLRGTQLIIKRAVDMTGAAIGLVLLSPLMALIALAVKLSSPGPVIFRQIRVGVGGQRFQIFKFRSMVRDAEAKRGELQQASVYGDGRLFKMVGDPRITRLGAFLRRTSLDELPQLFNVLRGDMSLVGPRPPIAAEVALYEEHHYSRFDMRPGITGPWQVSGRNKVTDFEEVVLLESDYMRGWTIWKDVAILLRTIPAVLRMDGAH